MRRPTSLMAPAIRRTSTRVATSMSPVSAVSPRFSTTLGASNALNVADQIAILTLSSQGQSKAVWSLLQASYSPQGRTAITEHLDTICDLLLARSDLQNRGCSDDDFAARCLISVLTNLTCSGDAQLKRRVCQHAEGSLTRALVNQLRPCELRTPTFCEAAAGLLRNLSWLPDPDCRRILRQSRAADALARCLTSQEVLTAAQLTSVLSALWNLTAGSEDPEVLTDVETDRESVCDVPGCVGRLCDCLTAVATAEAAGGVLRNLGPVVSRRRDLRNSMRPHLPVILRQLDSISPTTVANASCLLSCIASGRHPGDQRRLLALGADAALRRLATSPMQHPIIRDACSAALAGLTMTTSVAANSDRELSPLVEEQPSTSCVLLNSPEVNRQRQALPQIPPPMSLLPLAAKQLQQPHCRLSSSLSKDSGYNDDNSIASSSVVSPAVEEKLPSSTSASPSVLATACPSNTSNTKADGRASGISMVGGARKNASPVRAAEGVTGNNNSGALSSGIPLGKSLLLSPSPTRAPASKSSPARPPLGLSSDNGVSTSTPAATVAAVPGAGRHFKSTGIPKSASMLHQGSNASSSPSRLHSVVTRSKSNVQQRYERHQLQQQQQHQDDQQLERKYQEQQRQQKSHQQHVQQHQQQHQLPKHQLQLQHQQQQQQQHHQQQQYQQHQHQPRHQNNQLQHPQHQQLPDQKQSTLQYHMKSQVLSSTPVARSPAVAGFQTGLRLPAAFSRSGVSLRQSVAASSSVGVVSGTSSTITIESHRREDWCRLSAPPK